MTPEQAFSHAFIAKAVQELKGLRGQSEAQKGQPQQILRQRDALSDSILP
jgi:hypothetical protein